MSSWELELIDRMTGPAKRMGAAVAAVARELSSVKAVTAAVEKAKGKAAEAVTRFGRSAKTHALGFAQRYPAALKAATAASALYGRVTQRAADRARGAIWGARRATIDYVDKMGGMRGVALKAAGGLWTMTAAAAGAIALVGGGLVAAGAAYAAKMAAFKEQTLFAYKYITGSKQAASALFRDADALARATGGKTSVVAESLRELRAGGFGDKEAMAVTAAVADIRALNPGADVSEISKQLAKMKGAGRVMMENLEPILAAGIDDSIFYDVLRAMTGSKDQVALKKLMEAGKISADTGQAAILEAVNRMGKGQGLGAVAAERARTTVTGQVEAIEGSLERLFLNLETGPASGAIVSVLGQIRGALDPTTEVGGRLVAVINDVAAFGADVFERVLGGGNVTSTLGSMLAVVEAVMPPLKALGEGVLDGLGEAFGDVASVFGDLFGSLDLATGKGFLDVVGKIGHAIGYVVVVGAAVIGALVGVTAVIVGATMGIAYGAAYLVARLVGIIGSAVGSLWTAGSDLAAGLWNGIKAGWGTLLSGFRSLVELLPKGVRKVLGIASPSRVMAELGGFVGVGFALGVEGQTGRVEGAMAALVAPPDVPSLGPAGGVSLDGAGGLAARGGGARVSVVVNVTYAPQGGQAAAGPDELADRIGDVVAERLEDIALELGLGAAA